MNDDSPVPNRDQRTFVVGTAGHVDHGKSSLVRRLTGIDPDRLLEEKQREMTIDLGFAWLELPGGAPVSIIDVPGHERFIKNMLAGVGGLDAAMLVIAADEGPMPQTIEHLAILDLLSIAGGVVVITKSDLVDEDWLELVVEETRETVAGTIMANAPIRPVSASSGEGIDGLIQTLEEVLQLLPPRAAAGRARLPVDRVFSVSGFGTVVTGTLLGRPIELGQELEILPSMTRARVRGLQSHGQRVEKALPGSRTAINLAGIERDALQRGDVLTVPGWLKPTSMIDARLRLVRTAPHALAQNDPVDLFVGAAETSSHVTLLDTDEIMPGEEGWIQIRLDRPIAVLEGDQFIVRQASPSLTIGGGRVLNAHPRRHRRFREEVIRELQTRESGSIEERTLQALADGPAELRVVANSAGVEFESIIQAVLDLIADGEIVVLGSEAKPELTPVLMVARSEELARMSSDVTRLLEDFHGRFPLRKGMAREEVRSRTSLPAKVFDALIQTLVAGNAVLDHGNSLASPDHEVALSPLQEDLAAKFLAALNDSPMSPPAPSLYEIDAEVLGALAGQGKVVRVDDNIVFDAAFFATLQAETLQVIEQRGQITLAEFRDHFGSSRKYAQAVLEHFDQQRVTRRVGDVRVRGSG